LAGFGESEINILAPGLIVKFNLPADIPFVSISGKHLRIGYPLEQGHRPHEIVEIICRGSYYPLPPPPQSESTENSQALIRYVQRLHSLEKLHYM